VSVRTPALLVLTMVCSTAAHADPISDISRCAAVTDRDERLACYDSLGARYAKSKPTAPASAPVANAAAPETLAPSTASTTATSTARAPSAPSSAPSATPAQAAAPVAKAAVPADSRADFGLTNHQKPKEVPEAPKKVTAIEGTVTGFGHSPSGHMVVRLDDSQSWEFVADSDPMLAVGNKVTIRRALLGSFIMTTPTGRENRVKRLSAE
jgi:hypothetical protein